MRQGHVFSRSPFQQFVVRKRSIRRPPGKRYIWKVNSFYHETSSREMIRGPILLKGDAELYFLLVKQQTVPDTLNCCQIAEKYMLIHECTIFMQNSAACTD